MRQSSLAFLVLLFPLLFLLSHCGPKPMQLDPSRAFPALNTHDHDLQLEQLENAVVIINFFAPDCPPCIEELPELEKLSDSAAKTGQKVLFLGIGSLLTAMDKQKPPALAEIREKISLFQKEKKLRYSVFLADQPALQSWGVTGFPETFIFHRDSAGTYRLQRKFISSIKAEEAKPYLP